MKKVFYLTAIAGLVFASCTKPENPNPNEERTYSFSIEAEKEADDIDNSDGSSQTRIEIINNLLHWSVGDKLGLYIFEGSTLIVNNLAMTGDHSQPVRTTSFTGTLTQSEIESLNPNNTYKYISYFPYGASVRISSTMITLSIPQTITIRKNEFPIDHVIMTSITYTRQFPPITWLDDNGQQQWNERIGLKYGHILSYVRVNLNTNLMGIPVTKIEISSRNNVLSGNVLYIAGSTSYFAGGSGVKIVNIETGMNVGDEVYIPIATKGYSSDDDYTFKFTFEDGTTSEKIIPYDKFRTIAGRVHNITFNL